MSRPQTTTPRTSRPWIRGGIGAGLLVVIVVVAVVVGSGEASTPAAGGKPTVVLNPAPSPSLRGSQAIGVSVGPNEYFTPYTRIEILECADPGGQTANLPKSDITCDGNTAPGYSVLVSKDGSFSTDRYVVYSLPNAALGEARDNRPVCDQTHQCVLYVGQDQTNFTAPKVFSAPFALAPAGHSGSSG